MGGDKGKGKGKGGGGGGKGSAKRYPNIQDLPYCFKVLCPEDLVGSLMGNGGRNKDQIQDETGARLMVSQRNEYYPTTRFRILSVHSDSTDGTLLALGKILDKIIECGQKEKSQNQDQVGKDDLEFLGKGQGKGSEEYVFRVGVSVKMSGAIIGSKGAKVKDIRHQSRARVSIDKAVQADHQELKIVAKPDGIMTALSMINPSIQEESGSPWFQEWSTYVFPGGGDDMRRDARRPPNSERERSPRRGGGGKGGKWEERRSSAGEPESEPAEGQDGEGTLDENTMSALADTVRSLPVDRLEPEYEMSCDLPKEKVTWLIGRSGERVKDVRRRTECKIHFDEATDNGQQRMAVKGNMVDVYRCHAMMMLRYHQEPAQHGEPAAAAPDENVNALHAKIEELQRQLEEKQKAGKGSW